MSEFHNRYIMMLHGYLCCIATICGPQYSFGASSFKDSREIDAFVSEFVGEWSLGDECVAASEYIYAGKEVIGYRGLREEIVGFVFNGALEQLTAETEGEKSIGGSILWNLFEYYGLASTGLNESGIFHPLVRGPVYRLDIRHREHERALYFLVRIEDISRKTKSK